MISWNIDGLEEKSLQKRTEAVVKTIREVAADIVFLQEVIPETFSFIQTQLTNYECIAAKDDNYFVDTLLRRDRDTHLESTKEHARERKKQLICLKDFTAGDLFTIE